jgi:hypothetical protein
MRQDREEEEEKRKLKRVNTNISTQLKDELRITMLVLIYEQLLLFFWKEQVAYSILFWLTVKIWM